MSNERLKVAAAQYPVGFFSDWPSYATHIEKWVAEAAHQHARLLVFPEYFSLEISSMFGAAIYSSLPLTLEKMGHSLGAFLGLFRDMAQKYHVYICAGSFPVHEDDAYYNRSYFFWPNGHCEFQEKLQMTRFEKERWGISGGSGLNVFVTDFGKVAVNVCYDCEFPLFARRQVEQGADIILVPSCTDTLAGFHRVKIGCQARALENQCYVVQATLVGECAWSEAVDTNVGVAAFYAPADQGFTANGILAAGKPNCAEWLYTELDLSAIARVRADGEVLNHQDWSAQRRHVPR